MFLFENQIKQRHMTFIQFGLELNKYWRLNVVNSIITYNLITPINFIGHTYLHISLYAPYIDEKCLCYI